MATQDPKTDPEIEEKEEKEGPSLLSNITQMIILFWSLGVISYAYFGNSINLFNKEAIKISWSNFFLTI